MLISICSSVSVLVAIASGFPAANPSKRRGDAGEQQLLLLGAQKRRQSTQLRHHLVIHPVSSEPAILALPSLLTKDKAKEIHAEIELAISEGTAEPTESYQEDVFSKTKREDEDDVLRSILRPLVEDASLPSSCISALQRGDDGAPLEAFVHAFTDHKDRFTEEDVIVAANIIQRRKAADRWKSEDGVAIMSLSLDSDIVSGQVVDGETVIDVDWDAVSLGKRYEVPQNILEQLDVLVPRLLRGKWRTKDATIVKYVEGDLQVPHVDPCDATILLCLRSGDEGGDTCFPLLDPPLRLLNAEGDGLLFFSSEMGKGIENRARNTSSLHHGGRVVRGKKIVVQLMLEFLHSDESELYESWLDVVRG